jgi:hypothetical protein
MACCCICCEKFNKSNRLKILCCYCEFENCRECFNKYTLDTFQDPHCMNCKKAFTKDFLNENCTAAFINKDLKVHREQVLFDREISLLIETMPYIELENEIAKNYKISRTLEQERNLLNQRLQEISTEIYRITDFTSRIRSTINAEDGINTPGAVLPGQTYSQNRNTTTPVAEVKEVKKFVRKCPGEECRGFLNTNWICAVCEVKTCKDCNEPIKPDHQCDPKMIENMELIKKDSKPCPECGEFIFRIEGCYMMWCTSCNTPWDWKSGLKITTGNIHNPHYFEFLRKNNPTPAPQAGACMRRPAATNIIAMHKAIYLNSVISKFFEDLFMISAHVEFVEIPMRTPRRAELPIVANRLLRINYILKRITDEEFKRELRTNEKKFERNQEFLNIYQMFMNVCNDTFMNIWVFYNQNRDDLITVTSYILEQRVIFDNLIIYFNENMEKAGKLYKCVYPGIDNAKFYKNIVKGIR